MLLIQTMLSCGKYNTTMQIRIVSRFWFCRRPLRLKINIRRGLVYFRKSHVCAHKLDMQETDFSFTQFYRSWNHFSRCRFTHWRYSRSHSLGLVIEVFHSVPNKTEESKRELRGNRQQSSSQTCITPSQQSTPTSFQQTLITFHQIQRILVTVPCCMSLKTMRR